MRTFRPTRNLTFVTDPISGRIFPIPSGGADDDSTDGDDNDQDDAGDGDADDTGDGSGSDDDGSQDDTGDSGDGETGLTQADVDAQIARVRKTMETKHKREVRKLRQEARKEGDGNEDAASADTQAKLVAATARAVKAEARAAAIAAGVPKDRAARFISLVDLDDPESLLNDDGDLDLDAISSEVDSTLEEWPEFAPAPDGKGRQGASGAEQHGGDGKSTKTWTRAEIAALSPAEFEEHQADIQEQVKRGLVK